MHEDQIMEDIRVFSTIILVPVVLRRNMILWNLDDDEGHGRGIASNTSIYTQLECDTIIP